VEESGSEHISLENRGQSTFSEVRKTTAGKYDTCEAQARRARNPGARAVLEKKKVEEKKISEKCALTPICAVNVL